jgi:hypothetical protein
LVLRLGCLALPFLAGNVLMQSVLLAHQHGQTLVYSGRGRNSDFVLWSKTPAAVKLFPVEGFQPR